MGKIRRIIPFGLWPAHWGLSGSTRETALAEYYWEGEELAYRLLDIKYPDSHGRIGDKSYLTEKLNLDYRYHKIREFEYGLGIIENDVKLTEKERDREVAKYLNRNGRISAEELEYKLFELSYEVKGTETYHREKLKLDLRFNKKTPEEADRALLDIKYSDKDSLEYQRDYLALKFKYNQITEKQMEKEIATLNKEPWFDFMGADKKINRGGVQLAVELDWNEYFVEFLEGYGWTGNSPDEIVDRWFEDMMRQQLNIQDEIDDDGSMDPMPMAGKVHRPDGLTEYR